MANATWLGAILKGAMSYRSTLAIHCSSFLLDCVLGVFSAKERRGTENMYSYCFVYIYRSYYLKNISDEVKNRCK